MIPNTLDGRPVRFTQHALTRLVEMDLDADSIRAILRDPHSVEPSRKYPGCINYERDGYAFATRTDDDGALTVITAVYSRAETLITAASDGRLGDGRTVADCTLPRRLAMAGGAA